MKTFARILVAVLAAGACVSALANVSATLDRTHIGLGESVRLLLESDSAGGQPDLGPLRRDFDILGTSRGSSLQIINGHASSQTQVSVLLAPKHAGTLHIPPLKWGGEQSPAMDLTVDGNGGAAAGSANGPAHAQGGGNAVGSDAVFLSTSVDQRQPYVQSAVILTVRLHAAVAVDQASVDLAGNSDVLVKQLGKDRQTTESRHGRNYQVVERRYLLIPQRSGHISLKGPVLDAQVQDPGSSGVPDLDALLRNAFGQNPFGAQMGMSRPLHLRANPIELDVLPRPASASGSNWLPAQKLTLQQSWQPDQDAVHVGDPLTRHLHLAAVGLTGAQLPDLSTLMQVPDGIKIYPDQAKVADKEQGAGIVGSRDQDIAVIASRPGHYVLPALRLTWWDTRARVQRVAELPARTLDVAAAAGSGSTSAPVAPQQPATAPAAAASKAPPASQARLAIQPMAEPAGPWKWASGGFAVLWLGTLGAWWYTRRRAAAAKFAAEPAAAPARKTAGRPSSAGGALELLQRACRENDAAAARRHLLEWAAAFWPDAPPRGLNAVAERLDDPRFAEPIRQLDRACYSGTGWDGSALAQAFASAPRAATAPREHSDIPDLYL